MNRIILVLVNYIRHFTKVLPETGVDLELLQIVLADPVLTQAVDPFVLQSVLVMANPQIVGALDKMINDTSSAGKNGNYSKHTHILPLSF